ncbi:MAG: MBL fold metallo-hydrolase [Candidatus Aenigmarchaeota archaeon]|nr:MBL fold metallo-hydrolase [Candidatus Aenigmarchaeota archaeon]
MDVFRINNLEIERLGHDCFRIRAEGRVIYIDPFKLGSGEAADLILITHEHFDHCEPESIDAIRKADTEIVAPSSCKAKLGKIIEITAGQTKTVKGFEIEAVHAYNVNKFREPGKPFHPKGLGVGYVLTAGGKRIYHAGDTDFIPEMRELKNIDIALLPVSGTYVMTPDEAAEAARAIRPRMAIPMHYGSIVGDRKDAENFARVFGGQVKVLG